MNFPGTKLRSIHLARTFKSNSSTSIYRNGMDYNRFLTPVSKRRQPSAIRALQPLLQTPGMISLGGGMPHPDTFPFSAMTVQLKTGETLALNEKDTQVALQYSATSGLPELVDFMRTLQWTEHKPPYATATDFDLCVFNGSQEGLAKAFDMLVAPGDHVLVESPMYSGALAIVRPMDCKLIDVKSDHHGIIPTELERVLAQYEGHPDKPKMMYSVPVACNPTGASTTLERKRAIYEIASKHDILILEDDPYYYLQFQEERTPSYFSMDKDHRVLRFDSFSKILSSGMRLGFATGPKVLIERMVLHSQATALHPCGVSQMLAIVLFRQWGLQGFLNHVQSVSSFYRQRRDAIVASAETHLKGLAEWHVPTAGMFLWIKLLGVEDTKALIQQRAIERKVIMLPGVEFSPNGGKSSYVRAAFSTATVEQMDEALKRLALLLQ